VMSSRSSSVAGASRRWTGMRAMVIGTTRHVSGSGSIVQCARSYLREIWCVDCYASINSRLCSARASLRG